MKKLITILLLTMSIIILTGCSKNLPNCPEGYHHIDESCVLKEVDETYDFDTMNTQYEMDIYIDEEERTMTVEGIIAYRNDKIDMDLVYLMMYTNAIPYRGGANTEFEYLRVNREDVAYTYSDIDDEILEVTPTETLKKGEFFEVEFKYTFHLWITGRLSLITDYMNAMFFYPVVAQYDGEWHLDEHSFTGEVLYTDLNDYDVTINISEDFVIASGGYLIESTLEDGRLIETYELLDARDYSLSAATDYIVYERENNDRTYFIYSRTELSEGVLDYHFGYIFDTFDYLEQQIGPYYYDYFKLELGEIYGMESSSIIYCSEDIGEITIIHEIVHQWFFFMIGNNQAEESWLDEGVTSYVTGRVFEELFGTAAADEYYYSRYDAMSETIRDRYDDSEGENVIQNVHEYDDYGFVVYRYGSTVIFEFVEQYLSGNHDQMLNILEEYYNQYNGLNASLEQFLGVVDEEVNNNLASDWLNDKLGTVQRLDE